MRAGSFIYGFISLLIVFFSSNSIAASIHVYSAVPMIGTEEVPPVKSKSYGAVTAIYDEDTNTLLYGFEWRFHSDIEATAAHFHGPGGRGESAGIRIDLGPVEGNSGKKRGSVNLSDSEETELLSGQWYINVHSTANPAGEIRAQMVELSPADTAAVYDASESKLKLNAVIVPGLGVYEAELEGIKGRQPLSLQLQSAEQKNF
ncbi:MAG: hypothetical protein AXA67_07975 [Methylothermaceae bacteria B42]|nr:MAG: hypothetical protein AXA67_07975 [Methylothermaceae bacteria B42]HHJ40430.1 CHRD domain-containing protein [Methylothermaceae bacterium]